MFSNDYGMNFIEFPYFIGGYNSIFRHNQKQKPPVNPGILALAALAALATLDIAALATLAIAALGLQFGRGFRRIRFHLKTRCSDDDGG